MLPVTNFQGDTQLKAYTGSNTIFFEEWRPLGMREAKKVEKAEEGEDFLRKGPLAC